MVPFVNLHAQYSELQHLVEPDVLNVMRTGEFSGGFYLERFEDALASYLSIMNVVGVSNGTDAITVTLQALNIGVNDRVIIPNNTFVGTAFGVSRSGAKVVLCDVNPLTQLIDLDQVTDLLKNNKRKKIKAVIGVDLYGQMGHWEELQNICWKYGVYFVQDAAQSVGSTRNKKHVGFYSDMATTSFYPTKNLGGIGQSGAVITKNKIFADRVRLIINQGSKYKNIHEVMGGNFRMDNIIAAYLFHALKKLDSWNEKRQKIAKMYNESFDCESRPVEYPNSRHIYHVYSYKCADFQERNFLANFLTKDGITYGCHYPNLVSDTKVYAGAVTPVAEELKNKIISLPIFPHMDLYQVSQVVGSVLEGVESFQSTQRLQLLSRLALGEASSNPE